MTTPVKAPDRFAALARELMAATSARDAHATACRWMSARKEKARAERPPSRTGSADGAIGIWHPRSIEGDTWFVRDPKADRVHFWADVDRIGPKRAKRVVLLGESCARGVPLDPLFNCAAALRVYLATGGEPLEIVDLAACGIGAIKLVELFAASRALDADLYILFAGNNWIVSPATLDLEAIAGSLDRSCSWRCVATACEAAIRRQVSAWMAAVVETWRDTGVPALFVLPAENLADSPLPVNLYNPLLDSRDQGERDALTAEIQAACQVERWSHAERLGRALVALEDGFSIVGLQTLGRCAKARGDIAEAIQWFTAAREMVASLPIGGLSSYAIRSDVMRACAANAGLPSVDLPREFVAVDAGRVPGREFFFDHCHMTPPGIVTAMSATAEAAFPLLGMPRRSRHELRKMEMHVDPRAGAQAHLVAARMNGNHDDLVGYHCHRALQYSSEILEPMFDYAQLRMCRIPPRLTDALWRLRGHERRFPALKLLDPSRAFTACDLALLRHVAAAVAPDHPDIAAECEAWRARERGVRQGGEYSLLACAETGEFGEQVPLPRRAFQKCLSRAVNFRVVAAVPTGPWVVRLTTRTGDGNAVGLQAMLLVNGKRVCSWPVDACWTVVECRIDAHSLQAGENVLTIVWPDPRESRAQRVQRVRDALASMKMLLDNAPGAALLPTTYTNYGDIYAFDASLVVANASQGGKLRRRRRAAPPAASKPTRSAH